MWILWTNSLKRLSNVVPPWLWWTAFLFLLVGLVCDWFWPFLCRLGSLQLKPLWLNGKPISLISFLFVFEVCWYVKQWQWDVVLMFPTKCSLSILSSSYIFPPLDFVCGHKEFSFVWPWAIRWHKMGHNSMWNSEGNSSISKGCLPLLLLLWCCIWKGQFGSWL